MDAVGVRFPLAVYLLSRGQNIIICFNLGAGRSPGILLRHDYPTRSYLNAKIMLVNYIS